MSLNVLSIKYQILLCLKIALNRISYKLLTKPKVIDLKYNFF